MLRGVVEGYRPQVDWGSDGGSATITVGGHNVKVGTSGWRRRCLFTLLIALLIIASLNFILTLWVLRRISFNPEGLGALQVKIGGVRLDGIANINDQLKAAEIRGRPARNLVVRGFYNISFLTVDEDNAVRSRLLLDPDGLSVSVGNFIVTGNDGQVIFSSSNSMSYVGAENLSVKGQEGAVFNGSVQTPFLHSEGVHELKLESGTRHVATFSAAESRIEARDGDVLLSALGDLSLTSSEGKLRLEKDNVFLPSLPVSEDEPRGPQIEAPPPLRGVPDQVDDEKEPVTIYQVCVCPSGRLFLAFPDSVCVTDEVVCR